MLLGFRLVIFRSKVPRARRLGFRPASFGSQGGSSIRSIVRRHWCGCHGKRQSTLAFGSTRKRTTQQFLDLKDELRKSMENEIAHMESIAKITTRTAWCICPAAAVSFLWWSGRLPFSMHLPVHPTCIVRLCGWIGGAQNAAMPGANKTQAKSELKWHNDLENPSIWSGKFSSRSRTCAATTHTGAPDRNKQSTQQEFKKR